MALPSHAGNACEVKSGAAPAALVELYTSEGCASCPPADLELRQLGQKLDANAVVMPLALHVSYWDNIGWKDNFAQKIFDARQTSLLSSRKNRVAGVAYTPQFFVNGEELRGWRDDFAAKVRAINARVTPLTITLRSTPASAPLSSESVALEVNVVAVDPHVGGTLYLAVSENALVS